jgi:hypothetical protein
MSLLQVSWRSAYKGGRVFKGTSPRDFPFQILSWISFLQEPDYTFRAFSNFFLKLSEIFIAQGAPPGVVDTGGKWKKSSIRKVLIIFLNSFGI